MGAYFHVVVYTMVDLLQLKLPHSTYPLPEHNFVSLISTGVLKWWHAGQIQPVNPSCLAFGQPKHGNSIIFMVLNT